MNTFTGHAVLGDGDPATGAGDGLEVFVTNIGNSGVAGNLGAGDTIELRSHGGGLWYLGAGETTDRNWILGARNNAGLLINNNGSGALQLTGNVTKDAAGQPTICSWPAASSAPTATATASRTMRTSSLE